jgi:hypothetical protein
MAQIYQIRVRGHLSDSWTEWFNGLDIEHLPDGDSLLCGPVADKAALHGLLTKVRDLNLTLIAVALIEPEQ